MTTDPKTCAHEAFDVVANTNGVILPTGVRGAVILTVKVACKACGTPFWFPGTSTGTSYTEPTTNIDGFQLSVPMVEANRRNEPDPSLMSVTMRNNDRSKGYRA